MFGSGEQSSRPGSAPWVTLGTSPDPHPYGKADSPSLAWEQLLPRCHPVKRMLPLGLFGEVTPA